MTVEEWAPRLVGAEWVDWVAHDASHLPSLDAAGRTEIRCWVLVGG